MSAFEQPIAPGQPLPHRKVIREWLIPLAQRTVWHAFFFLAIDFSLWFGLIAGTVYFEAWWAKVLCGLVAGFVIGRLFIIGPEVVALSVLIGGACCLHHRSDSAVDKDWFLTNRQHKIAGGDRGLGCHGSSMPTDCDKPAIALRVPMFTSSATSRIG